MTTLTKGLLPSTIQTLGRWVEFRFEHGCMSDFLPVLVFSYVERKSEKEVVKGDHKLNSQSGRRT